MVTLASAFIRLMPRVLALGGKLAVQFAKGVVDNLPTLKAAAAEAVDYLMTEAKSALKGYVNFLGDDEVKPFEKILALIPAVAAGFVGFSAVKGIVKNVKNFVTTLKGVGKAAPMVKKGMGGMGSSMSAAAKNILGAGAGFALAAAGIWLLVDACKQIGEAGPGAAVGLIAMTGGIVAVMAIAGKMGPEI